MIGHKRESGASLIEVGLVMPLLILLAIGLSEIGFLVIDFLTATNAAREGARTGAAAADYDVGTENADDLILEAVEEAACNLRFGTLETVTIFRAEADGSMPVDPNYARVYNAGALVCDAPGTGLTCPTCSSSWDPANRNRNLPIPEDLGVEVVFAHDGVTGLLPFPTVHWTETAVMSLEPDVRGQQ